MRASFRRGAAAERLPTRSASACSRTRACRRRSTTRSAAGSAAWSSRARRRPASEDRGAAPRRRDRRRARGGRRPRQARRVRSPSARGSRPRSRSGGRATPAARDRLGRSREHATRPRSARRSTEGSAARRIQVRPLQEREDRRPRRRARRARGRRPSEDIGQAVEDARASWSSTRTRRATSRTCPRTTLTPVGARRARARPRRRDRRARGARCSAPTGSRELEMGGLLAVAQGSHEEPRLIVLRYDGGGEAGARARRQGRDVRHRRHLDQARGQDAGDEDGHVGRRRGDRGDGRDRAARAAGQAR